MEGLIPYREVAKRLDRHPQTILKWLRDGYLPGRKIGKAWYVAEADLARFLADPPPYPTKEDSHKDARAQESGEQ
jgi:excisionase family DNA binding protein